MVDREKITSSNQGMEVAGPEGWKRAEQRRGFWHKMVKICGFVRMGYLSLTGMQAQVFSETPKPPNSPFYFSPNGPSNLPQTVELGCEYSPKITILD